MKKQYSSSSILVLEAPWELDESDSNRSSVLPFVEGIAKYIGDTEVYHANFYDIKSFKMALSALCKRKYKNTIVYIAAHGQKRKIGNIDIIDLLVIIGIKSKNFNITGVLLGSCYVGKNVVDMQVGIESSNLRWCVGYSSATSWLESTLIDCSILRGMSELENRNYKKENKLIEALSRSISPFSKEFFIGEDNGGTEITLRDSVEFIVQSAGQGRSAKIVTDEVFSDT